jgi:TPP-dependent pyruvate/acetoin dehydrogenase alpha subunit
MGIALAQVLGAPSSFPVDGVSFVSLGEGSANNAHFLSAMNLAEYACYNHIKVSDCSFKASIPLSCTAETKHCFRPLLSSAQW